MSLRTVLTRPARYGALVAGALPVLTFPGAGLAGLAWVALVPGLLLMRAAGGAREAAVRGWWFGAGFILTGMYWLVPSIGPALPLLAVVFGVLLAPVGWAAWWLLHGGLTLRRSAAALVVVPAVWVSAEFARSWHALGGPWALLGASQWEHPAVLGLASVGGVWLVSWALVAVNTAVVVLVLARGLWLRVLAGATALVALLAGPVAFAAQAAPATRGSASVALVQAGQTADERARLEANVRITRSLAGRPVDLVVWGESSTTADLDRDTATLERLAALSRASGAQVLVGEDARKADGRISKDAVLVDGSGIVARYRKIRLVPFGEYIPLRPLLGWVAGVSAAAGENRAPGSSVHLLPVVDREGRPLPVGTLICFESAFPDMSRAASRQGAELIVYQSATSTFQSTWAPAQHASLGALRAAETGRPVVQAALTGESVAYDAQGRRLVRLTTGESGAVTVRLALADPAARTWYVRLGDWVPLSALAVTAAAGAVAVLPRLRERRRPGAPSEPSADLPSARV
ncbi:apolipoprotein N-acyltransferase [Kitasatospora cheerisanensis]|uniref:Apolipoprotein N-acyltransferase n=1 Tax=Kitasatospora cheerisanensis KCTC 2395 TaxID=1348663 RepID=A0A066YNR4_9ACTN|nr:apolipoprotein N-acyltransferase [Kitasatospora cheerisanensis]KDN81609.1 putative apolipoprotein N-acyltransferase [Kitasatospora cheerisanensis KCTC 2395]